MSLDDIDLYQVRRSLVDIRDIRERAYEKLEVSSSTEFWDKFGGCLVPALSLDELTKEERTELLSSVTCDFYLRYSDIFGFDDRFGIHCLSKGVREVFVFAPNIFEFFFLAMLIIWKFKPKFKLKKKSLIIILLIVGIPNIIKEYVMHAYSDPGQVWYFFKDNLFFWLYD